ncbi:MAG: carboxypeptidase-like regulatory domain-containing protein, partial [Pyrinomonadaceae bacterium]|nr:carboxypeptidase-like regulatory domain-containing protein [Pyrinomonadaceae bacterium]
MKNRIGFFLIVIFCAAPFSAAAQSGGDYTVTQSVIASGGGSNSAGGAFRVDGTIGQPTAGTNSAGGAFNLRGGFWAGGQFAPTAAQVSISGRVFSGKGAGIIRRVRISLMDTSTGIERTTQTNPFGFYRFDELEIGRV